MHKKDVYIYGKYIEHENKWAGRYGRKGEKRAPRKRATPEQIKKQNQWKKEKLVLRLIRANFNQDALWITLKFKKGTRLTGHELKNIRRNFLKELRKEYKKQDTSLKYICRLEIGKNGGPHIHMVVNKLDGKQGTSGLIKKVWEKYGKYINFTPLYEEGDYKDLASYITKPLKEDEIEGQFNLFGDEQDKKTFSAYTHSQNLVLPKKKQYRYKRRTVEKLIKNGPVPTKGYYIDQDSIRYGVNPFTGTSYYYYTEIKLDKFMKEDDSG